MKNTLPRIIGTEMEYGFAAEAAIGQTVNVGHIQDALPAGILAVGSFLSNGSRLYNDMGHKMEYATPECLGAHEATVAEFAGERIIWSTVQGLVEEERIPAFPLRKRVVDDIGNTWGYHENYLVRRDTYCNPVYEALLLGHLATRTVFCGAGSVATNRNGSVRIDPAQKMMDIRTQSGNNSTRDKALLNTRDQPHADKGVWARQHVVCGDANITPFMTFLKLASTSAVIRLSESRFARNNEWLTLLSPLGAAHLTARDSRLEHTVELETGKKIRPVEYQAELWQQCMKHIDEIGLSDDERMAVPLWGRVLDDLVARPRQAARYVEWMAKIDFFRRQLERHKPKDPVARIQELDKAWDNIDPQISVGKRWMDAQTKDTSIPSDLFAEESIVHSFFYPPETRAKLRSELIHEILSSPTAFDNAKVSWDEVTLNTGYGVVMPNPYATTLPLR